MKTPTTTDLAGSLDRISPETFAERAQAIEREVGSVIVGQRDLVRQTMTGLLAKFDAFPAGCDPDFDTDFELLEREFAELRLTLNE